jgi:hypothetical protein
MRHLKKPFVVLFSLFALCSANSVFAVDGKVFSGNGCQPYFGSQAGDISAYSHKVYNSNGSYSRLVSCPIARDNTSNTNGISLAYVRVNRSSSTTYTLSCYLQSRDSLGTLIDSDSATYTGTGDASLYMNLTSSANLGYYTMYCSLPPYSGVYSYRIDEY